MKTSFRRPRFQAFTLIELLVVIAIIAILAAILFPVFAQAREKARQITCVSNEKQMSLAVLMYVQDYDETFPMASDNYWEQGWSIATQPYVKSYAVYRCPDDANTNLDIAFFGGDWGGVGISYNCNMDNTAYNYGILKALGPFGGSGFLAYPALNDAGIIQPSDSIMLAEEHNSDELAAGGPGNATNFGTGLESRSMSWLTVTNIPNVTPDGAVPQAAYPLGPNGSVPTTHSGLANFAFCDGHVKAMNPVATDPDPVNQPQNNLWDATSRLKFQGG